MQKKGYITLYCYILCTTYKKIGVWIKNVEVLGKNISNLSNSRWPPCIHGYHGNGTYFFEKKSYFRWSNLYGIHSIQIYPCLSIYMVVTIDLKCYSKLQYDISKYHEKTPADPLNTTFDNTFH